MRLAILMLLVGCASAPSYGPRYELTPAAGRVRVSTADLDDLKCREPWALVCDVEVSLAWCRCR